MRLFVPCQVVQVFIYFQQIRLLEFAMLAVTADRHTMEGMRVKARALFRTCGILKAHDHLSRKRRAEQYIRDREWHRYMGPKPLLALQNAPANA